MKLNKLIGTTSFRLSVLHLAIFLCSFFILGSFVYLLTTHSLEQQLKQNITSELHRLKGEYDMGGLPELITEINEVAYSPFHHDQRYGLLDEKGKLNAGTFDDFSQVEGWQIVEDKSPNGTHKDERKSLLISVIGLPNHYWLGVGQQNEMAEESGKAIIGAFLWGFLLVLVIGVISSLFISRAFLNKIADINHATEAIIAGDLNHRLTISNRQDELDKLALLLNRMLDKICTLITNVQQVTNDIAHDLRTPVSRLKLKLEETLKTGLTESQRQEQIASAISDVDNILDTFSAMLRIAQIESKTRLGGFKAIDFSAVVLSVTEALKPVAEEQDKTLSPDIALDLKVNGDKDLLTQMIYNVIENAILHTPEKTVITISLKPTRNRLELIIADNGPGILENYRQKVFQRFYRLEQSRTTAGNGLGLSIVAAIAELHQGKIQLLDNAPGLKVVFLLPALSVPSV
jgi:signal transduction histidine kinase